MWPELRAFGKQRTDPRLALQGLWALYASGGLDDDLAAELLDHPAEYVRAWTARLLGDAKRVSGPLAKRFAALAATDPSPVVRAQLLCTAKRLPDHQAWPVIEQLIRRNADANDPVVPWLLWWAIESKAVSDLPAVTAFFADPTHRTNEGVKANRGRLVRRYAAEGRTAAYRAAFDLLLAGSKDDSTLLDDLDRGLAERAVGLPPVGQGGLFEKLAPPEAQPASPARTFDPLPGELVLFLHAQWQKEPTSPVRTRLAFRAGLPTVRERVHEDLEDPKTPRPLLLERLTLLEDIGGPTSVTVVRPFLTSTDVEVRNRALGVLARLGGAEAGSAIVAAYPTLPDPLKPRAQEALFGRRGWAKAFLALVDSGKVAPADVRVEQVRLLALLEDKDIDTAVRKHWGTVRPGTPDEKLAEVRRFSNDLRAGPGDAANGKVLFAKHCGACHTLFGEGGKIGPDITNTSRADTAWLLASIVDPSAVVRSQYVQVAVRTTDEWSARVIGTGRRELRPRTTRRARRRGPRDRIESVRDLPRPSCPRSCSTPLTPQDRRDLFQYLQHGNNAMRDDHAAASSPRSPPGPSCGRSQLGRRRAPNEGPGRHHARPGDVRGYPEAGMTEWNYRRRGPGRGHEAAPRPPRRS